MDDAGSRGNGEIGLVGPVLAIVVGILVLALPDRTLVLVAALLGLQLVLLGVLRVVLLTQFHLTRAEMVSGLALAAVTVGAGILCFTRPQASLTLIALFVGIGWITDGAAGLLAGRSGASDGTRRMGLFDAVLAVAGGLMVVLFPHDTVRLLAQVSGVVLILIGLSRLATALAARRTTSRA